MGEERQVRRPALRVVKGEGRGEQRALRRLTSQPHRWLLALGAAAAVLAGALFLLTPALSIRHPAILPPLPVPPEAAPRPTPAEARRARVARLAEALELDEAKARALAVALERYDDALLDALAPGSDPSERARLELLLGRPPPGSVVRLAPAPTPAPQATNPATPTTAPAARP
jgi:hypothetical protein